MDQTTRQNVIQNKTETQSQSITLLLIIITKEESTSNGDMWPTISYPRAQSCYLQCNTGDNIT